MTDALLLLHAHPLDASMWSPQIDGLQGTAQVIAPNLPGFGGEPPAGGVMTMDAAADRAARALADAGVNRAVVCGLFLANTRAGADDEAGKERRRQLAARLRAEGNFLAESPPPLLSADAPDELWDR